MEKEECFASSLSLAQERLPCSCRYRRLPLAPSKAAPLTPVVSTSPTVVASASSTVIPAASTFIAVTAPNFTLIPVGNTFIPVGQAHRIKPASGEASDRGTKQTNWRPLPSRRVEAGEGCSRRRLVGLTHFSMARAFFSPLNKSMAQDVAAYIGRHQ